MLKLKNIIAQLEEEVYSSLIENFTHNKADKFSTLLSLYREDKLKDEVIIEQLQVNINSFYTLKSRLFDKIQEELTTQIVGSKYDLLKKASNIPELLFNTNKEIALAILLKMEKDMLENDLPYELTNVYGALKKLYRDHPKYYEYSQLYNKHIAYMLAADKAEDLLSSFNKMLSQYFISNDTSQIEVLNLMKQEMVNISKLYQSHHLIIYRNIVNISFALFIPLPGAFNNDEPIEDYLKECDAVFDAYPKDSTYPFYKKVVIFLAFEYYMQLKQYKKAQQYYEQLNDNIASFLLYNHCTVPSKILLSSLEFYNNTDNKNGFLEESIILKEKYNPDISDHAGFIMYNQYQAACAFYQGKYTECNTVLNNVLNTISFKNYPHAEIETKLLLSLGYLIENKFDQAESVIRSVSRKVKEMNELGEYENAEIFLKVLKIICANKNSSSAPDKIKKLVFRFNQFNMVQLPLFKYIKTDEDFVQILTKQL
ncbi:MAG: hypothetical protein M3Q58_13670 [Bacteroidota bacterium]|nr:hypothetical protein [Bacteroidota bacterium]